MKTGDRVKSKIKWDDGDCHIKIGDQGVIDIIRPQNNYPIYVIFDNGMDETFQECNLELVEKTA